MKKLNVLNLALFVLGCLTVGVFVNFVIIRNIFVLQGIAYITVTALSVIVCGLVLYLFTFLIIKEKKQKSAGYFNISEPDNNMTEELVNKIGGHLYKIKTLNNNIADKAVSGELFEIEKSIYKIQTRLKDETINVKRLRQLDEFFDYYMPLIVKILDSYRRIETNELTGENATETKNQVSSILPVIKKACEKELDNMLTDEMIDITTDIKVLESMLAKDGLLDILDKDKNNI